MKFKFIDPKKDPEYAQELMLRWEVLQKPLGRAPGSEVQPEERQSFHLIAYEKKKVIGCVLFCPDGTEKGHLFQMALSEEYQGKGFGRQMLSFLEQALSKKGFKEIYLSSTPETIGFYQRMGFHFEPKESSVQLMKKI